MHRFLQRVLPNGLVKVRYYGFWAAVNLKLLSHIKDLMGLKEQKKKNQSSGKTPKPQRCPVCHNKMRLVGDVKPGGQWPHAPPDKTIRLLNKQNGLP